jgi:tetratricopeptide (TPR) repeat protein
MLFFTTLGTTLRTLGALEEAEAAHRRALELEATRYIDRLAVADLARRRGDDAAWREAVEKARPVVDYDNTYNAACFESIAGNTEEALRLLQQSVAKTPGNRQWAKQDPDLEWIRGEARFWEIVGNDETLER